jgi:hypothetical protein
VNFETYLESKKIDSAAFRKAEKMLWESLNLEFDQMSPASFTAQKLYLINPIRRKYHLKVVPAPTELQTVAKGAVAATDSTKVENPTPKPSVARPMMRPKPKMS